MTEVTGQRSMAANIMYAAIRFEYAVFIKCPTYFPLNYPINKALASRAFLMNLPFVSFIFFVTVLQMLCNEENTLPRAIITSNMSHTTIKNDFINASVYIELV